MDLVEIRKKANSKKQKPAGKKGQEPESKAAFSEPPPVDVPGADEAPHQKTAKAAPDPAAAPKEKTVTQPEPVATADSDRKSMRDEPEVDPIDALFAYRLEDGLATTENYLQALVSGDEVVDSNIEQWLTFTLGDEEYALSIESVSEIIKPREVTDIPRVPDFISGIISLRGIIVPVFDLNRRLKLGTSEMSSSARIIVCQDKERLAGFIVDRINQVVNVPIANIEPPPSVLSGLDRDFVEGVGRVGGRMLILLHLSNVINAELV